MQNTSKTHTHFLNAAVIWDLYNTKQISMRKRDAELQYLRNNLVPSVLSK